MCTYGILEFAVMGLIIGAVAGFALTGRSRYVIAALSGWLIAAGGLIWEASRPYEGGGASMWPVALLFVGIWTAGAALLACGAATEGLANEGPRLTTARQIMGLGPCQPRKWLSRMARRTNRARPPH